MVYLGATNLYSTNLHLYRYQLTDLTNPALDQISKVGAFWSGHRRLDDLWLRSCPKTVCSYGHERHSIYVLGSDDTGRRTTRTSKSISMHR